MKTAAFLGLALTSLSLLSQASAYVVTLWEHNNCTGESRRHNTWDDTCSTPSFDFQSITPVVYGGILQAAIFYPASVCSGNHTTHRRNYWRVDGIDVDFQIGKCIQFHEPIHAMWSFVERHVVFPSVPNWEGHPINHKPDSE